MSGFAEHDLTFAAWRKSSHSGASNGDCVEVADGVPGYVPVRDSKDPQGPALVFPAAAWTYFVTAMKDGCFSAEGDAPGGSTDQRPDELPDALA